MRDLFEHYTELPQEVQDIILAFDNDGMTYKECEAAVRKLEPLGYTFEYGLDAVPYNLQKVSIPTAVIERTKQWIEKIGEVETITQLPNQSFRIKRTNGKIHTFRFHLGLIQEKLPTVGWMPIKSLNELQDIQP